ncbi:hypothetical protein KUL152_01920 [Tenacibaculum sp. KUL152]|nr:hypothetical protein KUL152_01920 [Tenacibaculum sp. KUL152]
MAYTDLVAVCVVIDIATEANTNCMPKLKILNLMKFKKIGIKKVSAADTFDCPAVYRGQTHWK